MDGGGGGVGYNLNGVFVGFIHSTACDDGGERELLLTFEHL